jgi:hypothetical protein
MCLYTKCSGDYFTLSGVSKGQLRMGVLQEPCDLWMSPSVVSIMKCKTGYVGREAMVEEKRDACRNLV